MSISLLTRLANDKLHKNGSTEPSPEFDIGHGITAQIVLVTPAMASEFLDTRSPSQRKPKRNHVRMLSRDLREGRWKFNGEPMIFDVAGNMANGQHRCLAIIDSGVSALCLIIRGVASEAYVSMDINATRSAADAVTNAGKPNATAVASTVWLLNQYDKGETLLHGAIKLSPIQTVELLDKFPRVDESVLIGMRCRRLYHSNSTPAFCHWVFAIKSRDDADKFFQCLESGEDLQRGSPILALRQSLERRSASNVLSSRAHIIALTFKAWNAWRSGIKSTILRFGDSESFPDPV